MRKIYWICELSLLLFLAISCKQQTSVKDQLIVEKKYTHVKDPSNGQNINLGSDISFVITVDSATVIDSVYIRIKNNLVYASDKNNFAFSTKDTKPGRQDITIEIKHNHGKDFHSMVLYLLSDIKPRQYTYKIINTFPHDPTSYTQGLVYKGGILYESTGLYNKSKLRKEQYKDGKVLLEQKLDNKYFGEGITIANDQIYQITWNEHIGFVYDMNNFKLRRTFNLPSSEGWGLAFGGTDLFYSDGSSTVFILDTATLQIKKEIQITDDNNLINNINEMEYVNGVLYANVYQTNLIIMIEPGTGKVLGRIDCSGLLKKEDQHPEIDVLNGIAYIPESKHFLITGKNWPKMFEVTWIEK